MKKIVYLTIAVILLPNISFSDTLTVKQDSTGNYVKIQDAITNASDGDFILVYPGIYYENIDFMGKSLFLSSLYCQTPSDSIILQTIIDGNNKGSCFLLNKNEQNCTVSGFNIQHGSGTVIDYDSIMIWGGAFFLSQVTISIEHCFIHDNVCSAGGGVYSNRSNVNFVGNRIYNNQAYTWGGGIHIGTEGGDTANIFFDTTDFNSIYLNYASIGSDLYIVVDPLLNINTIHIDTGTISTQNIYCYCTCDNNGFPIDTINVIINNAKIQQVDGDLYVSPSGDNNNTGIRPGSPLKTIAYALLKIKSNPEKQNTIWLSNGIYSASKTGERFGLGLKNNVAIVGTTMNETILDLENISGAGRSVLTDSIIIIKNLSIINGGYKNTAFYMSGLYLPFQKKIVLDSLHFKGINSYIDADLTIELTDSIFIKNSIFENTRGIYSFLIVTNDNLEKSFYKIENCMFINNAPFVYRNNGITLGLHGDEYLNNNKGQLNGYLINCLFADNRDSSIAQAPSSSAISIAQHVNATIINSTICNNKSTNQHGGAIGIIAGSKAKIYNSILYGNIANQIFLTETTSNSPDTLIIHNSCIENGYYGIANYGSYNTFQYYPTNISDDPMFLGNEQYYYNLNDNSPCIDKGTLNFPDSALIPQYDLAGNPRIVGGSIDMGAYEWNPMVGFNKNNIFKIKKEKSISVAPNPFYENTHIKINTKIKGELNVFNGSGVLVKHIAKFNNEKFDAEIIWEGNDDNNRILKKGIYFVVLSSGNKIIESVKVIKY